MFSDHYRFLKIFFICIILILLGLYSCWKGPVHFVTDFYSPDRAGETLRIGFARVTKVLGEGKMLVASRGRVIEVRQKEAHVVPGDKVSVEGRYLQEGYLEAQTITVHRYRRVKKYSAMAATVFILLLVMIRYRISWKQGAIVERKICRT